MVKRVPSIPVNLSTTKNVIESKLFQQEKRPYLGMSSLGSPCVRKLWLSFRWATTEIVEAKKQRIFDRGNLEEERIIRDLRNAGLQVFDEQLELVGFAGHVKGHIDGKALKVIEAPKTVHLLEFKTMADKYFKVCAEVGVEESNPIYYAQAQLYMGYGDMTRTLFVATNKNDESRHYERLHFNRDEFEDLRDKGEAIVTCEQIPANMFGPTQFICRCCKHGEICYASQPPDVTCRSCRNVNILDDGKWECDLTGFELSIDDQKAACVRYSRLF
jgi:hypothetical protein